MAESIKVNSEVAVERTEDLPLPIVPTEVISSENLKYYFYSSHPLVQEIEKIVSDFSDAYYLDKQQVLIAIIFILILFVALVITCVVWRIYSPIIQDFVYKERKRRMNSFKKFLNRKKVQNHFKKSGEGTRLNSGESSSQPSIVTGTSQGSQIDRQAAADIAAQAALKRMYKNETTQQDKSKKRIQMIAKRELEEERKKREELVTAEIQKVTIDEREFEHSSAIEQVFYTCELLGDDFVKPKSELMKDLQAFLSEQVETADEDEDRVIAAILMIHSLNKKSVKDIAIETISKYLQNILEHPDEEKYRSIRAGNKAFQERVASAVGGIELLKSVGFTEKENNGETFYVFTRGSDAHLCDALESLRNGQSVPIKVSRNLQIYLTDGNKKIKTPQLSNDFFNLTAEELKKEQALREQETEKLFSLRTKEMRMRDEQLRNYKYKYTLIRIRCPGNLLIQGVFSTYEPFSAVREFVASILSDAASACEYSIADASNQILEDETQTLAQIGLAPAAVLHLKMSQVPEDSIIAERHAHLIKPLE
ncbi:unnamed protein product [Caenorhabditis bovis]|uniref:UBX domain-containing protein n=1 Tax=Caenorhabditis bovis TaxID=2654633 RepID=A0A8S1F047_9PELO|nr:unnamed protein product [Caenorhabditis bovis]